MAQQKKKVKKTGFNAGKPYGMNHVQMMQWHKQLQERTEKLAKDELQMVLRDRQAQRMGWLYLVALNERYGFDAEQIDQLEQTVKEMAAEYNQMVQENNQDYADEKLRQSVSKLRGYEVKYLYEDQYPVNADRKDAPEGSEEATFAALRESDSRIY